MMNPSGKGLLLDLDGTLADSLPKLKATYFSFLEGYGSKGSANEFEALNGLLLTEVVHRLRVTHRLTDPPEMLLNRYLALVERAQGAAKPSAGAFSILERSRARGWRVGVVTSTPRRLALDWLTRSGLDGMIDAVVGGDDVQCGKPAPEPYRRAIDLLQCDRVQSLAVEDSPLGARAAVAAGITTLAISHSIKQNEWPAEVKFIAKFAEILEYI
jgi:HAD superfamily hydrolase (TIGR01509 family)